MAIATRTTSMAHSTIKPAQSWRGRRTRPGGRRRNKSLPKRGLDGGGGWGAAEPGVGAAGVPLAVSAGRREREFRDHQPARGAWEGGGDPTGPAAAEAGGAH